MNINPSMLERCRVTEALTKRGYRRYTNRIKVNLIGGRDQWQVKPRELEEGDTLLVLASDGVWEHLSDQEAVDIAAKAGGYCAGASSSSSSSFDNAAAARGVCAAARVAWTKESAASVDDITAVVAHIAHEARDMIPPRLASTTRGRAARMSIGAMMKETGGLR